MMRLFHGIFVYVLTSALKSRFLYLYIITTVLGISMVYGITSLGAEVQMPIAADVYSAGARGAVSYFCSIMIFLAVFAASRIFPRMLDPGMSGFFFCRPFSRRALLALTALSVGLTYSGIMLFCGGAYALSYVFWAPVELDVSGLFLQLGLETTVFLIYVPALLFFAVISRSGSYAFLGSFAIWLVAYLLAGRGGLLQLLGDDLARAISDTLYYILPKSSEISDLFSGPGSESLMPLWSSLLFAVALYALADWKLRRIDL